MGFLVIHVYRAPYGEMGILMVHKQLFVARRTGSNKVEQARL